jgi:Mn-containing catalase
MKTKAFTPKPALVHHIDKRQLVNLDLYNNEIKIMRDRLGEIKREHSHSKASQKKIEKLQEYLKAQKENLENFRQNYEVEEMATHHSLFATRPINEATNTETFYEHLKSFENEFKVVRQDINEFIAKCSKNVDYDLSTSPRLIEKL